MVILMSICDLYTDCFISPCLDDINHHFHHHPHHHHDDHQHHFHHGDCHFQPLNMLEIYNMVKNTTGTSVTTESSSQGTALK